MSSRSPFRTIFVALVKNRFRFGDNATKGKKIATIFALSFVYVLVTAFAVGMSVVYGKAFANSGFQSSFYLLVMLLGAIFVLIFGIVALVSTLYLAKDTDFYSALPVKHTTVFAAKILFVYATEAAIALAVTLPALLAYGITVSAPVIYYFITILTSFISPAIPLTIGAIFAIPVMYIAGKIKHRNAIVLVFYIVLFLAFFSIYIVLMSSSSAIIDQDITQEQLESIARVLTVIGYVIFPYAALSSAAFATPMYGLGAAASVTVNLLIFLAISAVLIIALVFLGEFMYGQSVKANNQTDNSKVKVGSYKSSGSTKALVKREFALAMRSTQTAFQCFSVFFLAPILAVLMNFMFANTFEGVADEAVGLQLSANMPFLIISMVVLILPSMSNAPLTSFSREGESIASLKSLPLSGKNITMAKAVGWMCVSVPASVLSAVLANVFHFEALRFVLSVIAIGALSASLTIFAVLWDLESPKLKWTDPMQAVKHNTHSVIGMFIGMGAGLPAFIAGFVMFAVSQSVAAHIVYWTFIFAEAIIFGIVDILLYRRADALYNKIEI